MFKRFGLAMFTSFYCIFCTIKFFLYDIFTNDPVLTRSKKNTKDKDTADANSNICNNKYIHTSM